MVRGIHQIPGSFCPLCCEMCGIYNGYLAAKRVGFFFFTLFLPLSPVHPLKQGLEQAIAGKCSHVSTEDSLGSLLENKL